MTEPPRRAAATGRRPRPTALLEQGLTPAQVLALRLLVDQAPGLGLGLPSADTLVLLRLVVLSYDPAPRLLSIVDGDGDGDGDGDEPG